MPYFSPPVVYDLPTSLDNPAEMRRQGVNASTNRMFSHFNRTVGRARGRTVVKVAGVYQTVDVPSQALLDTASEVYLGGHVYEVLGPVEAALVAAGYTTWHTRDDAGTVHGEARIPAGFPSTGIFYTDTYSDIYIESS